MTVTQPETDLPVIPARRDRRCPLAPPPEFAQWRAAEGLRRVQRNGQPTWLISRYTDIRAALVDGRLSANTMAFTGETTSAGAPALFPRIDDPEHHRLRRMMTRDFTFRRAEAMRPHIQRLVDGFLDEMVTAGSPGELVRAFALPVPSMVICLLLGVPYEDHEFFQRHSTDGLDSRLTDDEKAQSQTALFGYMFELVARKEREPGDDLMSRLIRDYVATGQLSRETAAMNGIILLAVGHETTASMISLGTVALLENSDLFAELGRTEDTATIANAIEELMRYLTIVHSLVDRVAVEDLTIGGQLVRAGETVLMNLPAGNWDTDYVAQPEKLDATQASRGHLGFGYGVHQCLGANLARVEMQIALSTLARRLPGLRLAVPAEDLRFQNNKEIYGLDELPVIW